MNLRNSTVYDIAGTRFYRLSSGKILDRFGSNLQNVERNLRRIYYADEDKILNSRDQSGAEALIVAYLCRPGNYRNLFIHNIKPHVFVALHLFKEVWKKEIQKEGLDIKCSIEELCDCEISNLNKNPWWKNVSKLIKSSDGWPSEKRYYFIAKQVSHSSNYGVGASVFCLNTLQKSKGKIVLKKKDAQIFIDTYFSLFPEIKEWQMQIESQVRETGILYNLLGYPITFTENLYNNYSIKEWYSAIAQSTVGCITRGAFIKMQNFIEETKVNWDLLFDTHDSYVTQSIITESIE